MATFGSLFAGIGGLDLGLERAGWECRWQVEIDPWCRRVLAKHWPNVPKFGDVRGADEGRLVADPNAGYVDAEEEVRARRYVLEPVDLICGGFPCQPVSVAGKRLGERDERWLWPEFARVVRLLRPRFVLVENVPGLFHRGFGRVLADLAESGYDCEWQSLRASDVGAPHRRERVFIVAYANGERWATGSDSERRDGDSDSGQPSPQGSAEWHRGQRRASENRSGARDVAFTNGSGRGGREDDEGQGQARRGRTQTGGEVLADADGGDGYGRTLRAGWWEREPQEALRDAGRDRWEEDGVSIPESLLGRVVDGLPSRVDRLRGLGNAVVPQVAELIGRELMRVLEGGKQRAGD